MEPGHGSTGGIFLSLLEVLPVACLVVLATDAEKCSAGKFRWRDSLCTALSETSDCVSEEFTAFLQPTSVARVFRVGDLHLVRCTQFGDSGGRVDLDSQLLVQNMPTCRYCWSGGCLYVSFLITTSSIFSGQQEIFRNPPRG